MNKPQQDPNQHKKKPILKKTAHNFLLATRARLLETFAKFKSLK